MDEVTPKPRNKSRELPNGAYLMCSDCGKLFKYRSELTLHIKSKCGTIKLFKCEVLVCEKMLMTPGSLHNHMLRHEGARKYMCRFCAKLFLMAGQLKVHERIHTKEKVFVCDECGKGFCHRQSLITHSTLHTGIKPFQCENCGNSFSCIGNLIKHRKTHSDTCGLIPLTTHKVEHPATKLKIKINTPEGAKLKKTVDSKETKRENLASLKVNGENRPIDKARITVKKFEEMKTGTNQLINQDELILNEHKQTVTHKQLENNSYHSIDTLGITKEDCLSTTAKKRKKETYNCECCNKTFLTKKQCDIHQQKEHSETLACIECDKIFSSVHSLCIHKKVYHKGMPRKTYIYVCDKCGKQFRQRKLLKYHEDGNCGSVPKFPCEICHKQFSTVHTRKSHMRVHDPEKKILCKFCGKSFHWKGQLKVHERSHTGEKPFACLYCPKAFAYRESLLTHSSLHTGIKPHLCEACGLRFSCIGNLIKHRVTHANSCGAWYAKNKAV